VGNGLKQLYTRHPTHTFAAKTNISSCSANQRKLSQEELSRDKGIFHDVGGYV